MNLSEWCVDAAPKASRWCCRCLTDSHWSQRSSDRTFRHHEYQMSIDHSQRPQTDGNQPILYRGSDNCTAWFTCVHWMYSQYADNGEYMKRGGNFWHNGTRARNWKTEMDHGAGWMKEPRPAIVGRWCATSQCNRGPLCDSPHAVETIIAFRERGWPQFPLRGWISWVSFGAVEKVIYDFLSAVFDRCVVSRSKQRVKLFSLQLAEVHSSSDRVLYL